MYFYYKFQYVFLGINLNIVECKYIIKNKNVKEDKGINLNIVECKFHCFYKNCLMYTCINLNIVECK